MKAHKLDVQCVKEALCVTLCQWTQLPPAGDAPFLGVLTNGGLQQEQRNPTQHSKHNIRNQEGT